MPTYSTLFHQYRKALNSLYDSGEAAAIIREILSEVTGITYSQSLILEEKAIPTEQESCLTTIVEAILQGMPMQYALGYTYFMGRKFQVNEHVLIPRPETEELVQWVIDDWKNKEGEVEILDIGTGSGCIPISLKSVLTNASVTGIDISEYALKTAERNAKTLSVTIELLQTDFLDTSNRNALNSYNVIISNPPYIPASEAPSLDQHVRDWEPHTALFVADNDPLIFYKAIAEFGQGHLKEDGTIYCELHADYALAAKKMFEQAGYSSVQIRKDLAGNWRMLKATSPSGIKKKNPTG